MTTNESDNLRKRAEAKLKFGSEDISQMSEAYIRKTVQELRTHQIELEMQNEELRLAQKNLLKSQEKLTDLYDFAPIGYVTVSNKGLIIKANLTAASLLGVEMKSLMKKPFSSFICNEDQDIYYFSRKKLLETKKKQTYELRIVKPDGTLFFAKLESVVARHVDGDTAQHRIIITDDTERIQAVEALQKIKTSLEIQVEERVKELKNNNLLLIKEVASHKRTLKELQLQKVTVDRKNIAIKEANIALKVLLKTRDEEKEDLLINNNKYTSKFITPYLNKLRKSGLNEKQLSYIEMLSTNIYEINSSSMPKNPVFYAGLTPAEIRIVNFIKQNNTNKDIATLLDISVKTVEKHRTNIRKKLGINNNKINLKKELLTRF